MSNSYYSGHQWMVTDSGIQSRDGWYDIHRSDLGLDVGDGGWPGHMAEKSWVDIEDFKRAFAVACQVLR